MHSLLLPRSVQEALRPELLSLLISMARLPRHIWKQAKEMAPDVYTSIGHTMLLTGEKFID